MPKRPLGACNLVWVDPGTTSGLLVCSINPRWLKGQGSPSWEGLGNAILSRSAYQVGRHPRRFDTDKGTSAQFGINGPDEYLLPVLAEQPLIETNARLTSILSGDNGGDYGRGDLSMVDAGEIVQVRQIAGLLDNYPTAALGIEDFTLRIANMDRETLSPARLRLAIETEEILHGEGRVPFLQNPDAMGMATDVRLKRANLYFPGMPHATDAARHALVFFRRCRADEQLRAQAFPRHFNDWEDE